MSENTTAQENGLSAEQLEAQWNALPPQMRDTISAVNNRIDTHNKNVALIKAASGDESKKLLFELRDQNPSNDAELSKFLAEITKLNERIETLTAKANERAQSVYADQLKTPTEDEVNKAREDVSKSGQELRAAVKATSEFSKLMGMDLGVYFKEITSLKGTGAKRSSSGGEIWRPRWESIYANDELIQAEVKNPKTGAMEKKSTFNILTQELNKRANDRNAFSVVGIQQECLKAAGGDKDNLPEVIEFDLKHTLKDGTEMVFHIKCKRAS